jgi:hypothetical protein
MPINYAADVPRRALSGISTRGFSASVANAMTCGERVGQEGAGLDILVQRRRDTAAAKMFFHKLLKGCQCVPRVMSTGQLKGYRAAKWEMLPGVAHRQHRYLNDRPRIHANPRVSGNDACSGSSRPGTPSAFSPATGLSRSTSGPDATSYPRLFIEGMQ